MCRATQRDNRRQRLAISVTADNKTRINTARQINLGDRICNPIKHLPVYRVRQFIPG
jgi:hypothetical protein